MADDKISMPSGMGGIVRYFDEYKSAISFQPLHVVLLGVLIITMIVLLHYFGSNLVSAYISP